MRERGVWRLRRDPRQAQARLVAVDVEGPLARRARELNGQDGWPRFLHPHDFNAAQGAGRLNLVERGIDLHGPASLGGNLVRQAEFPVLMTAGATILAVSAFSGTLKSSPNCFFKILQASSGSSSS